jgi:hypothetical protein
MHYFRRIFQFTWICFFVWSCTSKKEKEEPIQPKRDTLTVTPYDRSKPDPNIAVKDDYTKLTKADEEREDKTQMDISYFPSNYALDKAQLKPIQLLIRILYSRPHKRDRPVIFGDSTAPVPYNRVWRLGANESTEIEFLKPVMINNKKINAGRYTVYAIPTKEKWTVIFNSSMYTWGDFNYDATKDVVRMEVPTNATNFSLETFLIYFQKTATGCNMIMTWDNVVVALPINIP